MRKVCFGLRPDSDCRRNGLRMGSWIKKDQSLLTRLEEADSLM